MVLGWSRAGIIIYQAAVVVVRLLVESIGGCSARLCVHGETHLAHPRLLLQQSRNHSDEIVVCRRRIIIVVDIGGCAGGGRYVAAGHGVDGTGDSLAHMGHQCRLGLCLKYLATITPVDAVL